ncbi:MAG TPA: M17 family peptidase N-terminal domain-containing protein, partial [Longimicrobiaceae bacterium]|nr:M17 family peptidase N-terminal domain-containing protein [Longimicrobiaceae bacterium]
MNITVIHGELAGIETPLLAVPVFEGDAVDPAAAALDQALGGAIAAVRADLRGREGDTFVLYPRVDGVSAQRVLLV